MVGCITLLQTDTTGTTKDSLASFYSTLCADMNTPVEETIGIDFGSTFCFEDSNDDYFIQLPPNFEVGGMSHNLGGSLKSLLKGGGGKGVLQNLKLGLFQYI